MHSRRDGSHCGEQQVLRFAQDDKSVEDFASALVPAHTSQCGGRGR
jgi:hypothetical protein